MMTKMQFFDEINKSIEDWDALEASYLNEREYFNEESEDEDE